MLNILYRLSNLVYKIGLIPISSLIDFLSLIICNSYLKGGTNIGRGTKLAYGGIGLVIHKNAVIGSKCVVGQGVTIGAKEAFSSSIPNKVPVIGDNVYIAAGARILGDIHIGSNSIIGANAVVLKSFPSNSIIVGAPATSVGNTDKNYLAIRS